MKKRYLLSIMTLFLFFAFMVGVKAEECTVDEQCLVQIGNVKYYSFQDAVEAVEGNGEEVTIKVINDSTSTPGIDLKGSQNKNIVIDFDGHTVQLGVPLYGSTGYETQNIHLEKGSKFTFKNGTLKAAPTAKMLIQNYLDLTLENMTIDATTAPNCSYALSNNNGKVSIIGNTSIYAAEGKFAFDAYWWPPYYNDGAQVVVDTIGTIKGKIEVVGASNLENSKTTLDIKNINHEGSIIVQQGLEKNVHIYKGTFTNAVSENLLANTSVVTQNNGKYIVGANTVLADEEKKIEFESEEPLPNRYSLEVKEATVEEKTKADEKIQKMFEDFKDPTLISLYDISVLEAGNEVEITDGKFKITLPLAADAKGYDFYKVVYIDENGVIKESIPAKIVNGKLVFETTHLSTYGIVGYNKAEEKTTTSNPKTGDNILTYVSLGLVSLSVLGLVVIKNKKFN